QILVQNWFRGPTEHFKLNSLYFADGSELSQSEIESLVVYRGTPRPTASMVAIRTIRSTLALAMIRYGLAAVKSRVYGEADSDYARRPGW
ncbi:hypothetical protein D0N87_28610, partial [Pseudomonas sp. ATCC 13867]